MRNFTSLQKEIMSGIAGNIARQFINSKLTPLLMLAFLAVGFYSATLTPKEEEPQIDVPIADIFLEYPGAGSLEVESRVVKPLEDIIVELTMSYLPRLTWPIRTGVHRDTASD